METCADDPYDRGDANVSHNPLLYQQNMASRAEPSTSAFMEEVQRYECIYNKFSKDYKNKQVRENCWTKLAEKFGYTAEEAERRYKNLRTSYGRYLKKLKNVPSGSGRDAIPTPGEFANLSWLDPYISHRSTSSNFSVVESNDYTNQSLKTPSR